MTTLIDMLRRARRMVLRRGISPSDADDLVQEAFLRLESYERVNRVQSKEAFLVTAAVNLSIDRARRRSRSPFDEQARHLEFVADVEPGPEAVIDARARLRHANAGLQQLPERTRRILLARRLDGLSYAEIAEREGMSKSSVEKQVARATLSLMRWMDGW